VSALLPEIEIFAQARNEPPATFWTGGHEYARYVRVEMPAAELGAVVADPSLRPQAPLSLQRGHAAVWQRTATLPRANLIAEQKQAGILTILESDDDYTTWDPSYAQGGWVEFTIDRRNDETGSVELHQQLAGYVDRVIVASPGLADVYSRFSEDVRVVPNAVRPADWPELSPRSDDGVLRVGWLTSPAHAKTAEWILPTLLEIAAERSDVRFYWIGLLPPMHLRERGVKAFAWHDDWSDFKQRVCSLGLDVGIAPLNDDHFSRCKSDLKLLEYGMAGAMPIASAVEPYTVWAAGNVKLVERSEWKEALLWCADNQDQVRAAADAHRQHVLGSRTIHSHAFEWENAIR
jgi:hypothetical protein